MGAGWRSATEERLMDVPGGPAPALCKLASAQWLKSGDKKPQEMFSKEILWMEEKDGV